MVSKALRDGSFLFLAGNLPYLNLVLLLTCGAASVAEAFDAR